MPVNSMNVLRVQEKITYTFTSAANNQIPNGKNVTIPLAVNVDLSAHLYAVLVVRIHSMTSGAGTGTAAGVTVTLYNSAPTSEDPALVFRSSLAAAPIPGTVVSAVASSTTGPTLQVDSSTAGKTAAFGDVLMLVSGWGTTAADLTFTISVDLVLKS